MAKYSKDDIQTQKKYKLVKELIKPIKRNLIIYITIFVLILVSFITLMLYMNFAKRGEKLFLNPFYYKRPIPAGMSNGESKSSSNNPSGGGKPGIKLETTNPEFDSTKYYVIDVNDTFTYPLYTSEYYAKINSTDGIAIQKIYSGIVFYMPNTNQNIQQTDKPLDNDIIEFEFN